MCLLLFIVGKVSFLSKDCRVVFCSYLPSWSMCVLVSRLWNYIGFPISKEWVRIWHIAHNNLLTLFIHFSQDSIAKEGFQEFFGPSIMLPMLCFHMWPNPRVEFISTNLKSIGGVACQMVHEVVIKLLSQKSSSLFYPF